MGNKPPAKRTFAKRGLSAVSALALAAAMLAFAPSVVEGARASLTRFAVNALPALLPFLVAAKLIAATGAGNVLGAPLRPVARWLGLPESAAGVLAISIIAGYPSGARLTADLAADEALNRQQAETLALAASHPGPLFVLGTVAPRFGGALWGLLILASCAVGGIVGAKVSSRARTEQPRSKRWFQRTPWVSPIEVLPEIIRESCISMLPVCGSMVFFGVILELLERIGFFALWGSTPRVLITGTLEMVAGCEASLALSGPLAAPLCAGILGWGGMAVIAQSLVFLRPCGVSSKRMLLGKAMQAAATGILAFTASLFVHVPALPAWAGPPVSNAALWWFPPAWLVLVIALCWALYRCSRARKS